MAQGTKRKLPRASSPPDMIENSSYLESVYTKSKLIKVLSMSWIFGKPAKTLRLCRLNLPSIIPDTSQLFPFGVPKKSVSPKLQ